MEKITLVNDSQKITDQASVLSSVLKLLNQFIGETFIIEYSGAAMIKPNLSTAFVKDIVTMRQMGLNVIVVHGGIDKIEQIAERYNVLDKSICQKNLSIEMVEMMMSGLINKQIVSAIDRAGGMAIGLSGKDTGLIEARRKNQINKKNSSNVKKISEIGYLGEIVGINPEILLTLEETPYIPVISPLALGEQKETLLLQSYQVASVLASTLSACKLIMITDHSGIKINDNLERIIRLSTLEQALKKNTFDNKLLPKIESCLSAIKKETESAHIVDGRVAHSLLLEIFSENRLGTMIMA